MAPDAGLHSPAFFWSSSPSHPLHSNIARYSPVNRARQDVYTVCMCLPTSWSRTNRSQLSYIAVKARESGTTAPPILVAHHKPILTSNLFFSDLPNGSLLSLPRKKRKSLRMCLNWSSLAARECAIFSSTRVRPLSSVELYPRSFDKCGHICRIPLTVITFPH